MILSSKLLTSLVMVLATSNVNGRALSLILFLTLFYVVSFLILSKKSCPSQVNVPTEKKYNELSAY